MDKVDHCINYFKHGDNIITCEECDFGYYLDLDKKNCIKIDI